MPTLTAKDIMVKDILTVSVNWSVDRLTRFLIEHSITGAPVLDEDQRLAGVVSLTDIARHYKVATHDLNKEPHDYYLPNVEVQYAKELISSLDVEKEDKLKISDIMTPMVFSVSEDTTIQQVADAMIRGRIHRVLVVKDYKVIGIITTLDMLKVLRDL